MENFYCVVTFHVTQHALIFEKELKKNHFTVKLMPTPREISTSCGTSAMVACSDKEKILNLCHERSIPIDEFHKIESKKDKSNSWFLKHIRK